MFLVHGSAGGGGGDGGGHCGSGCPVTALTPLCAFGGGGPGGAGECVELPFPCPEGTVGRLAWTAAPGGWQPGSAGCYAPSVGVPASVVAALVRDRVVHRVPALDPVRQPSRRALVTLPVLFHSGQESGKRTWTDTVAGFPVTTSVAARWTWEFGDGATLGTSVPGSTYPDTSVSHTYDTAGERRVLVRAVWDGTFSVGGIGPFAIGGAVTQDAALPVAVVEAHAVLVPDRRLGQ